MAEYSELVKTLADMRHAYELARDKAAIAVESERLMLATAINQKWSAEHLQEAWRDALGDVTAAHAERIAAFRALGDLLAHAYLEGQMRLIPPDAPADAELTPRESLRRQILTAVHQADIASVNGDQEAWDRANTFVRELVGYDGIAMDEEEWPADPHRAAPISFYPEGYVPTMPCMGCGRHGCDGECVR